MPWKNGLGSTKEIAKKCLENQPFIYRASNAQVGCDSPFSDFTGYDRFLVLLKGKGMILQFISGDFSNKDSVVLDKELAYTKFRGEEKIFCKIIDGMPCEDFNWMTLREKGESDLRIIELE